MNTHYFSVCGYGVTTQRRGEESQVHATVEVRIGKRYVSRGAAGVGPVHALDSALRECLKHDFPEVGDFRLSDYRVTVVDPADGTGAKVHVQLRATDGAHTWDAGCVSENIIEASFEALCSAAVLGIMRRRLTAAGEPVAESVA
jgi:2-isopropylmalate synthase